MSSPVRSGLSRRPSGLVVACVSIVRSSPPSSRRNSVTSMPTAGQPCAGSRTCVGSWPAMFLLVYLSFAGGSFPVALRLRGRGILLPGASLDQLARFLGAGAVKRLELFAFDLIV